MVYTEIHIQTYVVVVAVAPKTTLRDSTCVVYGFSSPSRRSVVIGSQDFCLCSDLLEIFTFRCLVEHTLIFSGVHAACVFSEKSVTGEVALVYSLVFWTFLGNSLCFDHCDPVCLTHDC